MREGVFSMSSSEDRTRFLFVVVGADSTASLGVAFRGLPGLLEERGGFSGAFAFVSEEETSCCPLPTPGRSEATKVSSSSLDSAGGIVSLL